MIKNIYITGYVKGSYRTQYLIKYFSDNNYNFFYNSQRLFYKDSKGVKRIILLILRIFDLIFDRLIRIYQIMISDLVVVPAMCNEFKVDFIISKLFKKKILSDFYISFYDTFVLDRKQYEIGSRSANRLLKFDKNIIDKSSKVLFLNNTEANRYLKLTNSLFDIKKHSIVPLVIEEHTKCNLDYFYNKRDILNICWWGSYIPLHGLEKIIDACNCLKKKNKTDFHFYLFGTSSTEAVAYINQINSLDLYDVITIDNSATFSNGKLVQFLEKNCDLVLGNFGDSEKSKNVIVNKIIDGVAMKAPILTRESKASYEFFDNNILFYCNNTPEEISNKIIEISHLSQEDINPRLEAAYKIFSENFSTKAYNKKLDKILNELD